VRKFSDFSWNFHYFLPPELARKLIEEEPEEEEETEEAAGGSSIDEPEPQPSDP
jgi:hypothetical protein